MRNTMVRMKGGREGVEGIKAHKQTTYKCNWAVELLWDNFICICHMSSHTHRKIFATTCFSDMSC